MYDKEVINTHILAVFDRLLEMGYTLQQVVDATRLQVREFDLLLDTQFAQANPLNDAEMNALRAGDNIIDTIRLYRDRTKCSLGAAKRAIDLARDYLAGRG